MNRDVGSLRTIAKKLEKQLVAESKGSIEDSVMEFGGDEDGKMMTVRVYLIDSFLARQGGSLHFGFPKVSELRLVDAIKGNQPWCSGHHPITIKQGDKEVSQVVEAHKCVSTLPVVKA